MAKTRLGIIASREKPTSTEEIENEDEISDDLKIRTEERKKMREDRLKQFTAAQEEEREERKSRTALMDVLKDYILHSKETESQITTFLRDTISKRN